MLQSGAETAKSDYFLIYIIVVGNGLPLML